MACFTGLLLWNALNPWNFPEVWVQLVVDNCLILLVTTQVMWICSQVNFELASHPRHLHELASEYDQRASDHEQLAVLYTRRPQDACADELVQDLRKAAQRARSLAEKIHEHDARVHFLGFEISQNKIL